MNITWNERFVISLVTILCAVIFDFVIVLCHPTADPQLIGNIQGTLNAGGFIAVINYWLGSSKGSNDKDVTIATQQGGGASPPPPPAGFTVDAETVNGEWRAVDSTGARVVFRGGKWVPLP